MEDILYHKQSMVKKAKAGKKKVKRTPKPKTKRTRAQPIYMAPVVQQGDGFFGDAWGFVKNNLKPSTALNILGKAGVPYAGVLGDVAGMAGMGRVPAHLRYGSDMGIVQKPSR